MEEEEDHQVWAWLQVEEEDHQQAWLQVEEVSSLQVQVCPLAQAEAGGSV